MAEVTNIGLARLASLEDKIGASEHDGLRARWEFGRELVAARDGKGRLPNGYLARVVEQTGASRAELTYRMQFAERFPAEPELLNAVEQFKSWHAIVKDALPAQNGGATIEPTDPGPLPDGTFRTIVADPPWQYGNKSTRGAAEDHYATMTMEELASLDVEAKAADEAHLYLWVTNNFLREGFDLLDAWGFDYKTALTWAKPQIGMGNYFRGATEHILFGVRGGLRTNERDIRNWFEAPRGKHSAKPDCFYDLVEKASSGPYLELFARRARLGDWSYWGNEALQGEEVANVAA
jgi:N6-adenosine-specific RNA methylase IME4